MGSKLGSFIKDALCGRPAAGPSETFKTIYFKWFGAFLGEPFGRLHWDHVNGTSVPMQRGARFPFSRSVPMQRGARFLFSRSVLMQRGVRFFTSGPVFGLRLRRLAAALPPACRRLGFW